MAEKIPQLDVAKPADGGLKFTKLADSPRPEMDDRLSEDRLASVLASENLGSPSLGEVESFVSNVDTVDALDRLTKVIEKKKSAIRAAEENSVALPISIAAPSADVIGKCSSNGKLY